MQKSSRKTLIRLHIKFSSNPTSFLRKLHDFYCFVTFCRIAHKQLCKQSFDSSFVVVVCVKDLRDRVFSLFIVPGFEILLRNKKCVTTIAKSVMLLLFF